MTQGSKAGKKCAICSLLERSKINILLEFFSKQRANPKTVSGSIEEKKITKYHPHFGQFLEHF